MANFNQSQENEEIIMQNARLDARMMSLEIMTKALIQKLSLKTKALEVNEKELQDLKKQNLIIENQEHDMEINLEGLRGSISKSTEFNSSLTKQLHSINKRINKENCEMDEIIAKSEAKYIKYNEIYKELPIVKTLLKSKISLKNLEITLHRQQIEELCLTRKINVFYNIKNRRSTLNIVELAQVSLQRIKTWNECFKILTLNRERKRNISYLQSEIEKLNSTVNSLKEEVLHKIRERAAGQPQLQTTLRSMSGSQNSVLTSPRALDSIFTLQKPPAWLTQPLSELMRSDEARPRAVQGTPKFLTPSPPDAKRKAVLCPEVTKRPRPELSQLLPERPQSLPNLVSSGDRRALVTARSQTPGPPLLQSSSTMLVEEEETGHSQSGQALEGPLGSQTDMFAEDAPSVLPATDNKFQSLLPSDEPSEEQAVPSPPQLTQEPQEPALFCPPLSSDQEPQRFDSFQHGPFRRGMLQEPLKDVPISVPFEQPPSPEFVMEDVPSDSQGDDLTSYGAPSPYDMSLLSPDLVPSTSDPNTEEPTTPSFSLGMGGGTLVSPPLGMPPASAQGSSGNESDFGNFFNSQSKSRDDKKSSISSFFQLFG